MTIRDDQSDVLIRARLCAEDWGVCLRTWRTWDAAGLIPRPVRVGRSVFWRKTELDQWIAAGCPRRDVWEAGK